MSSDRSPLAARLYVAAVIAVGIGLLVYVARDPSAYHTDVSVPLLAIMALTVMVGEIVTVKMAPHHGDVAPSNLFTFALLIVGGPGIAILAMFVACTIADLRDGKSPSRMAFNSSQYTIALYLSWLTLTALVAVSRPAHFDVSDMVGIALAGAVLYGINIAAVFDTDPEKVGRRVGNVEVSPYPELSDAVGEKNIIVGVLAVPAASAQQAANDLVDAGVKIVFNYSEALLDVPGDVQVHTSNPAVELLYALYFHLT